MARIFVNFRNGDGDSVAGFIAHDLIVRFGRDQVFRSSESIELGVDFVEELSRRLAECDVLLAVIGTSWLTIAGADGRPKIHDTDDWVRREIAVALRDGKRVVPVLIGKAKLPDEADLPSDIKELARRQYLHLQGRELTGQRAHLIAALVRYLEAGPQAEPDGPDIEGTVKMRDAAGRVVGVRVSALKSGKVRGRVKLRDVTAGGDVAGVVYDAGTQGK